MLRSAVDREAADYICMLISMFGHQTAVPLEKIKKNDDIFFFKREVMILSFYGNSDLIKEGVSIILKTMLVHSPVTS